MIQQNDIACAACGGPIVQGIGPDGEFCSIPCFRAGRAFCKGCGKPLPPTVKGNKRVFCGPVCKSRDLRDAMPISSSLPEEWNRSVCKACGKPITQPKNGIRQFCNQACRSRYHYVAKHKLDI